LIGPALTRPAVPALQTAPSERTEVRAAGTGCPRWKPYSNAWVNSPHLLRTARFGRSRSTTRHRSKPTEAKAEDLINRLKDRKPAGRALTNRISACFELADLGLKAKSAVPSLASAVEDPSYRVPEAAVYALGKIGPSAGRLALCLSSNLQVGVSR
jgi:hypothetical protein